MNPQYFIIVCIFRVYLDVINMLKRQIKRKKCRNVSYSDLCEAI